MTIKAVLFDLDGTLLPMDQELFVRHYFKNLMIKMAPCGYTPDKLIENIWKGIAAMVQNDGTCTNEQRFWDYFCSVYGEKTLNDKSVFQSFYQNEFERSRDVCGYTEDAKAAVELAKQNGRAAVLATNPIFPAVATQARIRWAGLSPEDFILYTTYENSCFSKPNPAYYTEILQKIGCRPEECVMVGNDVTEDMVAETLGMKVFLLTDCMINKNNEDISKYPHGGFAELKAFLSELS